MRRLLWLDDALIAGCGAALPFGARLDSEIEKPGVIGRIGLSSCTASQAQHSRRDALKSTDEAPGHKRGWPAPMWKSASESSISINGYELIRWRPMTKRPEINRRTWSRVRFLQ